MPIIDHVNVAGTTYDIVPPSNASITVSGLTVNGTANLSVIKNPSSAFSVRIPNTAYAMDSLVLSSQIPNISLYTTGQHYTIMSGRKYIVIDSDGCNYYTANFNMPKSGPAVVFLLKN